MSGADGLGFPDDTATTPAPPNSWSSLAWGGSALVTLTLAVAMLSLLYLRSRPVDMTAHTNTLAAELRDAFAAGLVPAQSVKESGGEIQSDEHALWTHRELEVMLAEDMDLEVADRIVRRELARRELVLADGETGHAARSLVCKFLGRPYATVWLVAPMPVVAAPAAARPAAGEKADFSPVTRRLRGDLLTLFTGAGVPFGSIRFGESITRENAENTWAHNELEVELPDDLGLADAVRLIRVFVDGQGLDVTEEPGAAAGTARVLIAYRGMDCMGITLARTMRVAATASADEDGRYALPELSELPLDVPFEQDRAQEPVHYEPGLLKIFEAEPAAPLAGEEARVPAPPPTGTARAAIIVDDGGYGNGYTDEILAIDAPLSLAILPYTPHARRTATLAAERGFEILLHMPMESFSDKLAFPGMLEGDMDAATIADLTRKALAEVPGATGANNHTGSKLTADAAALRPFLEVLKENNLFFVDSRTTRHSVALDTAIELGLPAQGNNLFLDNSPDPDAIRAQFDRLAELALERGQVVGICHFRPATAAVLAEAVAGLREKGVEIVPVSALLRQPPRVPES
jgi:uncharacterized protein